MSTSTPVEQSTASPEHSVGNVAAALRSIEEILGKLQANEGLAVRARLLESLVGEPESRGGDRFREVLDLCATEFRRCFPYLIFRCYLGEEPSKEVAIPREGNRIYGYFVPPKERAVLSLAARNLIPAREGGLAK